jgi:hypothetical protein
MTKEKTKRKNIPAADNFGMSTTSDELSVQASSAKIHGN